MSQNTNLIIPLIAAVTAILSSFLTFVVAKGGNKIKLEELYTCKIQDMISTYRKDIGGLRKLLDENLEANTILQNDICELNVQNLKLTSEINELKDQNHKLITQVTALIKENCELKNSVDNMLNEKNFCSN